MVSFLGLSSQCSAPPSPAMEQGRPGLFMGLFMAGCMYCPAPFTWALPGQGPAPHPVHPQGHPESCFSGFLTQEPAMPRGGHHRGHLPSAPSHPAWETSPWPSPLPCQDMALQNALYTGDLARLQDLFPPHSTADLLLESRAVEPRWISHQRAALPACLLMSWTPDQCREQGQPLVDRQALCARLVERPGGGSKEHPDSSPGPIAIRTASGPTLAFWQAVLAGDTGSVSRILSDSHTSLAPDCVFDTSDPEGWRDFRYNIRALRLWSLTYQEELTTPLHVAASRGHTEVLQLLLRRRARPDSAPGGRTALHEACAAGHTACVHVLLVAGADPNLPDQDGKRPLHLCRGPDTLQCVDLLLRFGAQVDGQSEEEEETPLHTAARLGHVELADLLLRRGACPDACNAEGWTPLLAACDTRCQSPADAEATSARCFQLCHLLLSAGADADAVDKDRQRPLHLACRRGHAAVVELLLSCGISANAMDYGGHTALHCALQGPAAALAQTPEHVVRALLNHGAVRVWPGALPKVLERWCSSPRTIEVLMNTYSVVKLPEEAVGLIPPEMLQKHQRFYSSLFALVRQPRSLQHLSRCALRAHLADCLPLALPRLPLPPRLLRYLQLEFEDVLY